MRNTRQSFSGVTEITVNTGRFGELQIESGKIITLEKPILGFERFRLFILVESEEMAPFIWLQSLEDTELAFLLINPTLFFPDYCIEVNPKEVEDIGVIDGSEVETYVIVTAPENPIEMTANLQGPVIVNTFTRQSKQLALVNSRYSVCEPLITQALREQHAANTVSRTLEQKETVGV